jgi:hypothetical protein
MASQTSPSKRNGKHGDDRPKKSRTAFPIQYSTII